MPLGRQSWGDGDVQVKDGTSEEYEDETGGFFKSRSTIMISITNCLKFHYLILRCFTSENNACMSLCEMKGVKTSLIRACYAD